MTRPGADMREAELLQKLSDIARMKVDAEPLGDDVLEVDTPPAHNAVLFPIGACFTICANAADLKRAAKDVDPRGILRVQYLGARFDPEEFRRDLLSLVKE